MLGITLQAAQTWKRKVCAGPVGDEGGGGGLAAAVRERLALASALRQKNQNSQNEPGMCPGINSFTFWRLTSPSQLGARRVAHTWGVFAMCASEPDRYAGGAVGEWPLRPSRR